MAHDPGQKPDTGIHQDQSRDLAAREHVIADRHLLEPARIDHALVHAFEPSADEDNAVPARKVRDPLLA